MATTSFTITGISVDSIKIKITVDPSYARYRVFWTGSESKSKTYNLTKNTEIEITGLSTFTEYKINVGYTNSSGTEPSVAGYAGTKTVKTSGYEIDSVTYNSVTYQIIPDSKYARYRIFIYDDGTGEKVHDKTYTISKSGTFIPELDKPLIFDTTYRTNIGYTNRTGVKPSTDGNYGTKYFTTSSGYGVQVIYDANGGVGAPDTEIFTNSKSSISVTISSKEPTRIGYTFLGWSTSKTATSSTYKAGGSTTRTGSSSITDFKLYAVWKMNTYYAKLVYDANEGSGAPSSVPKNARSDGEPVATIDFTVSNRKPTRTGYNFLGWARTATATTVLYTGGETHSIMTASTNSDNPITHTLYAVWQPIYKIKITYNKNLTNVSVTNMPSPSTQTAESYNEEVPIVLSEKVPTAKGYVFFGWSLNPDAYYKDVEWSYGDSIELPGEVPGPKNYTLYAIWDQTQYAVCINYYPIPGLAVNSQFFWEDTSPLQIQPYKPTRENRTFLGWSKNEDASTVDYLTTKKYPFPGSMDGVEHYYLYGVWAPLYWFDVFLDVNGGVSSSGSTTGLNCSYSSESQKTYFVFPDETPTRKDHRFLGWATSPSATVAEYHAGDEIELVGTLEGEVANWHNFYAVWVTTYTVHVKYDANGGTGGPIEGIFTNDNSSEVTITISDTFPTLADYSFLGWSTKKSDTSPLYYASKEYHINVDTGYTEELILYAIWKERIKGNYAYIVIKENTSPIEAIPYIYNGTKWVQGLVQIYTGTSWNPG